MKKIISLLLVIVLLCTGCAGGRGSGEGKTETGTGKKEEKTGDGMLRLYVLDDWPTLHEEILQYFEAKYPEYKVQVEVGVSEKDGITMSDAIRNLNAEMMAGNGPDILLLDGLPVQDYIEKGLLSDLSGVVEILKNEEERYFENVLSAYAKDGKICAIPSAFTVPIIAGDEEAAKQETIHNLTELLVGRKDDSIPVVSQYVMNRFPLLLLASWSEVFPDSGKADKKALSVLLKDMKRLADVSGFDKDLPEYENWSPMEVNDVVWAYNFGGSMLNSIGLKETQIEMGTVESYRFVEIKSLRKIQPLFYEYLNRQNGNQFIPKYIIGINSSSRMKKEAELFVKYFLKARVIKRENSRNNFLSVNKNALESRLDVSEKEEKDGAIFDSETNEVLMYNYTLIPEDVPEIFAFLDKADTMIDVDFTLWQTVMSLVEDYIYEENTLENVVDEIVNRVEIYQAE